VENFRARRYAQMEYLRMLTARRLRTWLRYLEGGEMGQRRYLEDTVKVTFCVSFGSWLSI
jgi:hypothetical protein